MKTANKVSEAGKSGKFGKALVLAILAASMISTASAQSVASATTESPASSKSFASKLFGQSDWTEIQKEYATPREICRLIEKNVRYTTEKVDNWSSASETWARGRGDCEDFAILIQDLCRISGMSTKVHLYFPATGGREGHAVLVGEWNGKTWFSSNGSYEEVKSEDEVKSRVAKMLSCKAKQLYGMKLDERAVAKYIAKSSSTMVAVSAR
jgi:predicted transglutaminase-like cysteine proteinase